jgi:site-specific recombinase XerD
MADEIVTVAPDSLTLAAWAGPRDRHPLAVYLARLAPGSRPAMLSAARLIAATITGTPDADPFALPWHAIRYQHAQSIRATLAERYAPKTSNRVLVCLRGVLKEAFALGQMSADDYQRARLVQTVAGTRLAPGRALDLGELRALFRACRDADGPAGLRDAAALGLLYGAGLRAAEACRGARVERLDEPKATLRVVGKRNKERPAYLPPGALDAVRAWLDHRGRTPGPILCSLRAAAGQAAMAPLSLLTLRKRLRELAEAADVRVFHPHDLRRSFITHHLDRGVDIATVKRLAGHESIATTELYDLRGEHIARGAAMGLHVPYEE